ncbi:MAG: NUMOD4 motif-containing HNH endonuclease [Paraclostridium sp.]
MEKWLPVVGFENLYEVSNQGNVRTIATGRIKKPTLKKDTGKNGKPRLQIMLYKNNSPKAVRVHVLVVTAFIGAVPENCEINHLDGDPTNCSLNNLEITTKSENKYHAYKNGLRTNNRAVIQIDPKTNQVVAEHYSICEAARVAGYVSDYIGRKVRNGGGIIGDYYWKLK